MAPSHPLPVPCQWSSRLAATLDHRSTPQLAFLFVEAVWLEFGGPLPAESGRPLRAMDSRPTTPRSRRHQSRPVQLSGLGDLAREFFSRSGRSGHGDPMTASHGSACVCRQDPSQDAPPVTKLIGVGSIGSYFESLSDPRHERNRKHLLVDIAVIAVRGVIRGCDGPTSLTAGPGLAHRGLPSTSRCSTALLLETASVACSWASSPIPSSAASGPGSPTPSRSTEARQGASSRSTARPAAGRAIKPRASGHCTSSAPERARSG